MHSFLRPLALVAFGASLALPAHATVVIIPELPELANKVEVIAHVVVADQKMLEEGGRIWTRTTLTVKDGIKGAKENETLVVHQLGGRVGDRQMWIAGAYKFVVGTELVFFGSRWGKNGAEAVIPFGVGYGIFEVRADDSGRLVVHESIGDVVAYKSNADGSRAPFKPVARTWESVAAFKDEVRGMLAAEQAGVGFQAPGKLRMTPKVRGGAQ